MSQLDYVHKHLRRSDSTARDRLPCECYCEEGRLLPHVALKFGFKMKSSSLPLVITHNGCSIAPRQLNAERANGLVSDTLRACAKGRKDGWDTPHARRVRHQRRCLHVRSSGDDLTPFCHCAHPRLQLSPSNDNYIAGESSTQDAQRMRGMEADGARRDGSVLTARRSWRRTVRCRAIPRGRPRGAATRAILA